jgi:hypothetical protein
MREWMLSNVRWVLAGASALLALLAFRAWWSRRHHGRDAVRHVLRLADEIAAIAETIEADLGRLSGHAPLNALRARCRESRERADNTFQRRKSLDRLDVYALEDLVGHLHDDHRRIVDLRWEVDSALAGAAGKGSRVYKFTRSRFPSSSFPTRPSTMM